MAQTETEIVQGIGSDYEVKYGFHVAEGVNQLVGPEMGALVITHYQRILNYVTPDHVHVFVGGRVVASGGPELAHQLESEGYEAFIPAGVSVETEGTA